MKSELENFALQPYSNEIILSVNLSRSSGILLKDSVLLCIAIPINEIMTFTL
jgi:hypothetical protein